MADHRPLLDRLRHTPDLAKAIPQLQPLVLHRLIQYCGLEDCAEIVALATPAQIERVLDVDLWRAPAPGRDEAFDASRFGDWLDVLMEAGEDVLLEKLSAIDVDLVIAGFSRLVRVFDVAAVMPYETLDGDQIEGRSFGSAQTANIGGFVVVARDATTWHTAVHALASLNAERPVLFHRLMRACVELSSGPREEDASHALLGDREQNMFDLASARDARRDAVGYVTPADARAFLESSRHVKLDRAQPALDPLAVAYFRALASADAEAIETAPSTDATRQESAVEAPVNAAAIAAVMDMLADAGVVAQPRGLLTTGDSAMPRLSYVRLYLEQHPSGADELAYLTNLMMTGGSIQGRPFSTQEAPEVVAATCNLGLENWPAAWSEVSLVAAFQVGLTTLHREVCLNSAESVIDTLATVRQADREIQLLINQLRRELIRDGKAGAPWRARESFDVIMMLDATSWAVILGLIDETPVLHAAARAATHAQRTIDPADFEFIADNRSIQAARDFLAGLAKNLR
jgi:hypothetical protein